MPEAVVRLLMHQAETGCVVNVPGGTQNAVGPQRDLPIADLSCESYAFAHQAAADSLPAHLRLDQQQTESRDCLRLFHQEDRANDLAALLCDPATVSVGVKALNELCDDAGNQRLKALVPPIFLGIQHPVAMNNPTEVAGLVGPGRDSIVCRKSRFLASLANARPTL